MPELLNDRLVPLDEATFAAAQQVVPKGIHAFCASLAAQGGVERKYRLPQVQLVQHAEFGGLQAETVGRSRAHIEPGKAELVQAAQARAVASGSLLHKCAFVVGKQLLRPPAKGAEVFVEGSGIKADLV